VIVPYPHRREPWRWTLRRVGVLVGAVIVLASVSFGGVVAVSLAQAPDCVTSPPPDTQAAANRLPAASLAGHPVSPAAASGDLVFVSLRGWNPADRNGIEVLRRQADGLRSAAVIRLRSRPAGLALSPDGKVLLAALDDGVAVLDAARAAAGDPRALLGTVSTGSNAGTAQLVIAGRYVFTADETSGHVSVLDLPRLEAGDFGPSVQVATVTVDMGPAGLGVSPDGRYVYVASQVPRPVVSLGPSDFVYGLLTYVGVPRRGGTLSVIDVKRIELDAAQAVVARVPAGCGPVRVAVSPDGRTVWVVARRSNELLAFRADQVVAGRAAAPVARLAVGVSPQGLRLVRDGRFALVASADRSRNVDAAQSVVVVDTAEALAGRPALRKTVTVGGLPNDIAVSPDQKMAFVANNGTSTLSTLDLASVVGS
jgi:DNA-binding beta-propeller fold protein YncE